jgi:phosphoglycolate phosphatase
VTDSSRRLVLFDIDGTLLSAGRASREALASAFAEIVDQAPGFDGYDFSGKTDPQIVFELLGGESGPAREAGVIDSILEAYLRHLERRVGPDSIQPKPGTARLLARLADSPGVTLGLLTGNVERGARLKLGPPGFNGYFSFGAFGSDDADRYRLPRIAVERALERTGREFREREVVVVGDSIHDVACGRSLRVRTVAVATGLTPPERLAAEGPDALLPDFSDTGAAVDAIVA